MKLSYLLIFLILFLYSCSKPVYTVFYKDSNQTIFTTKEIKISTTDNRDMNLVVSKNCPGRTMCAVNELKLIITLETQFSFLEAKDFYIKTDADKFDLNSRDYRFIYDVTKKAPDGTSGVAIETWTVWIKTEDFKKIAQSKIVILEIGEYSIPFEYDNREPWRVVVDNQLVYETLSDEQKRAYVKYAKSPSSELEVREKFERKARLEAEEESWKLIKESNNVKDLEFFLDNFPDSPYSIPARLRLQQLRN